MIEDRTNKIVLIVFVFIIIYIIPIYIVISEIISDKSFGILGIISWIILLGSAALHLLWYAINWIFIKKVKDENYGEKYVGVVLTNNSPSDKYAVYGSGILLLIKYLKKKHYSFKIIKKFDRQKFNEFIYDANCYGFYIIGHGTRHSLKVGKGTKEEEVFEYSKFKDAPKKEFVVQLHCNTDGGESLSDIIATNKDKSYVPPGKQLIYYNNIYFLKLLLGF